MSPLAQASSGAEVLLQVAYANAANKALNLEIYNGSGALTGGHADNTLTATALYVVADI